MLKLSKIEITEWNVYLWVKGMEKISAVGELGEPGLLQLTAHRRGRGC